MNCQGGIIAAKWKYNPADKMTYALYARHPELFFISEKQIDGNKKTGAKIPFLELFVVGRAMLSPFHNSIGEDSFAFRIDNNSSQCILNYPARLL